MSRETSTAQWYKVTIPSSKSGSEPKARILQNDFETLFTINGAPKGAGLFRIQDEKLENHFFYFSPGAVAIAHGLIRHFSGAPCPAPVIDAHGPVLLVGHADALEMLSKSADNPKPRLKRKIVQILRRK
jgi:hypothetical protein